MNEIDAPLFQGQAVCLTAFDLEKDPEIEAAWSYNLEYAGLLREEPLRPLLPKEVKELRQAQEKEDTEKNRAFCFAARLREDDRLIGFVRIHHIYWVNGDGALEAGVGDPEAFAAYLKEMHRLALDYAFDELGLFSVRAWAPAYRRGQIEVLEDLGFTLEVRQRERSYYAGRRWDLLGYCLTQSKWNTPLEEVER